MFCILARVKLNVKLENQCVRQRKIGVNLHTKWLFFNKSGASRNCYQRVIPIYIITTREDSSKCNFALLSVRRIFLPPFYSLFRNSAPDKKQKEAAA